VTQGGTGATKVEDARSNLGLGSSATRNAYSTSGDMLSVGDFGIGGIFPGGASIRTQNGDTVSGFYGSVGDGYSEIGVSADLTTLVMNRGHRPTRIHQAYSNRRTWFSYYSGSAWSYYEAYTTGNTTKTSDGTLKAASPIVKIYSDGLYETNEESQGCTVTRLAVGEYLIEGCTGMNSDATWGGIDGGFDIPHDRNKQPLIWLDYEVNADGSVLVKTYHRTHPDAPAFARNLIGTKDDAGNFTETVLNGEPIDIPDDVFISVRVEMPADSVYNRSLLDRQRMELAE
ncbi:phage tail protein, partial [Kluyvera intermedia]|uniref:phage tail fiber protein n=1 Tax=Kluyvera intermedia TaxID=61648 RepID=UPI003594F2BD